MTRPSLALIAHDEKKSLMTEWAVRHRARLAQCELYATGTTGGRIREACPELQVTLLKSGPLGGDQQVGALICEGKVECLIFFVDPLTPQPHDVDVKALTRLALVYDIPMALNPATAEHIMRGLASTA
jgi:methylglyoxal synthase